MSQQGWEAAGTGFWKKVGFRLPEVVASPGSLGRWPLPEPPVCLCLSPGPIRLHPVTTAPACDGVDGAVQAQLIFMGLPCHAEGSRMWAKSACESISSHDASSRVTRVQRHLAGGQKPLVTLKGSGMTRGITSGSPPLSQPGDSGG